MYFYGKKWYGEILEELGWPPAFREDWIVSRAIAKGISEKKAKNELEKNFGSMYLKFTVYIYCPKENVRKLHTVFADPFVEFSLDMVQDSIGGNFGEEYHPYSGKIRTINPVRPIVRNEEEDKRRYEEITRMNREHVLKVEKENKS